MELQTESAPFELPQTVLDIYPQLIELSDTDAKHIALNLYYYNRSIQEVLNTLNQGRTIRGLTATWVDFVLDDIRKNLKKLKSVPDAHLLRSFVANEGAILAENCQRWSE